MRFWSPTMCTFALYRSQELRGRQQHENAVVRLDFNNLQCRDNMQGKGRAVVVTFDVTGLHSGSRVTSSVQNIILVT